MMRDLRFLRRGKSDEIENVPVNPRDMPAFQPGMEPPCRAPLNVIQEPRSEQEGTGRSRVERTPAKPKGRGADPALPHRTPGTEVSKKRFGWAPRTEPSSVVAEAREDGYGIGGFTSMTPRLTRTVGRAVPGYTESNSTQNTPMKSVSKALNFGGRSKVDGNGGLRGVNIAALCKGVPIPSGSGSVVNTVEVPHFDLKEDSSFWMDHSVQVIIRIRPLNGMERSTQGYNRCLKQESSQCVTYAAQPETRFTFDHVACETIDQETLFRMTGLPMVENCLSGYNSCMFAYGQTGSGKTYTMLGEIDDLEVKPSLHRGMTPRIFEFLFARIQAEEESRRDEKLQYYCKCSFLEIYNEQITDLLDPSSTNLLLREDVKTGVYVENLSECEVHTVSDILRLLIQGSSNRRVAATNMNRESSRSHSVFTCVIESRWEKDSTKNLRFARLNLVDLAGSERQKTSGAEGERLKEAASINKSLSTLGHVIMVLVDVANGRPRHIPYRDSRLTFLLQDSLGGNSKTMIIANISPSICSAAETLNTLKFAQRAKLIQNNAVVNEDSTGDVNVLRHQIRLLQEELSILKRQNISRALSFGSATIQDTADDACRENKFEMDEHHTEELPGFEPKGTVRMSINQLKSLETTLAGALRREQMAETTIKEFEAEIEQLNSLVGQREEDTRSTKMMLRFREDKIQRMESLLGGSIPSETYLSEENKSLMEQNQLLQDKVDKNPEVTRFALENIRLLEQLKRFQEFYEGGERDLLQAELSKLRDQLLQFLDGNSKQQDNTNLDVHLQFQNTMKELDECRHNLNSCLDENAKLNREINGLHSMLSDLRSASCGDDDSMDTTEDLSEAPVIEDQKAKGVQNEKIGEKEYEPLMTKHDEEMLNLQLELDIVRLMLTEERASRCEAEKWATNMKSELEQTTDKLLLASKQNIDTRSELDEVKSVIEALESQQILSIDQMEDLRNNNSHYMKLLSERELEIMALKEKLAIKKLQDSSSSNSSEGEVFPLQTKMKRMQASLEKAKMLNMWYQNDSAYEASNEEKINEVQRQAEAETAEVIVYMQEELATLQQQVEDSHLKEMEARKNLKLVESELNEMQENMHVITEDNKRLSRQLEEKCGEVMALSEEWDLHSREIEELLTNGEEALLDASAQLDVISNSFPQRRIWISDQVGRLIKTISEKEALIEELRRCLEEANDKRKDVECMLKTLKGATLAITEAHQHEYIEKENEIILLTSELSAKTITVQKLEKGMKLAEDEIEKASIGATVAFVIVNRLSEINLEHLDSLKNKDVQLSESAATNMRKEVTLNDQAAVIDKAEKQIKCLKEELAESERNYAELKEKYSSAVIKKIEDLEENDISTAGEDSQKDCMPVDGNGDEWTDLTRNQDGTLRTEPTECLFNAGKHINSEHSKAVNTIDRDVTILLLKKEIDAALESLKEVQAEIAILRKEKEDIQFSEKRSQENMKCLITQVLNLQEVMSNFEKQSGIKMDGLDYKLHACTQIVKETGNDWSQTYEFIEAELGDSRIVATQKTAEASCILAKFEEAQGTLTEADIIINELMIANESMKLDIKKLKKAKIAITEERDTLMTEVKSLQSINDQNRQEFQNLEQQFASNLVETKDLVVELEGIVAEIQAAFMGNLTSISCDFNCMKSLLLDSKKLLRSWLEGLWSEILVKDCAVSVLHLCHMGILLETVTGLNTENGLLQHGVCESNSVVANLREHNCKSRQELEMCRLVEGKLLADIKRSFDRISSKEEETGELSVKVATFEKKISDLQLQEELMLQRSNYMGSQLAVLMKEIDMSNSDVVVSLLNQEKLLNEKEEVLKSEAELSMVDLYSKDFESLILASELGEVNTTLQKENCLVKNQLCELMETNTRLSNQVQVLEEEHEKLMKDVKMTESTLDFSATQTSDLDQINQKLQEEIFLLETLSCKLKNQLDGKVAELSSVEDEKRSLRSELTKLRTEKDLSVLILEENKSVLESCKSRQYSSDIENHKLQDELLRKDAVLEGLLFDLSLLQESASSSQDQKDKLEEMIVSLEALEEELASKSGELDEVVAHIQVLKTQLQEKTDIISALELNISKECKSRELLASENAELRAHAANALSAKKSMDAELAEKMKIVESLEIELSETSNTFRLMNDSIESLRSDLNEVTTERDCFLEELERAEARAEESEAIATEAQQIAETRKNYAEEKEAEVKLLERSVEELECTVNVLESKVDIIKGEAEQQRLQREDLELELLGLKHQLQNVDDNADSEMTRLVGEKEKNLQEAMERVQVLEKNATEREAEITKLKGHISELNLYAEAQASEYKQKFKALEAMAEQVKPEGPSSQSSNSLSTKPEKNATRPRGSGSPFKCIGLGLGSQIKFEKDEDLTAARLRIKELESLAVNRQKEIFSLNARLAAAESMTHDVIRDLLGLKLDMSNYASLLDNRQVQKITENAQHPSSDSGEQDATNIKKHLNELIKDRKGWLEESERRHAELVTTQIALENLRQQEQLLKTENDMLKIETVNLKNKVMELSGQQNIQQRIHHHAKIKEENNNLRLHNEDLKARLQRGEIVLSRVKEELAHHRASASRNSHVSLDENQNMNNSRLKKKTSVENKRLSQPSATSSWRDDNCQVSWKPSKASLHSSLDT